MHPEATAPRAARSRWPEWSALSLYAGSFCGSMPEMIGERRTYCHLIFVYPGASPQTPTPAQAGR